MAGCKTYEPIEHKKALTVGSEVEVSSDEERLKGAWFRATIIEYPDSSTSSKSNRALVEYQKLVTECGSKPLKEYVDLTHLRHLPPAMDDQQDFVEGDVVDVDYKYGWWTGIIKKVLGNSKYRVFFENPPDLIEFEHKDLRFHQDLVGEDWVRPERQQTTGSTFSSGNDVEVNFDKQDLDKAWFPAVVVKENEDNAYLVKYQKSKSGYKQEIVDSHNIRLPHPSYSDGKYKLLEEVEVFFNFAWHVGQVTDVLNDGMCMIDLKCGIKGKKHSYSNIRPIVKLKEDRWDKGLQEIILACDAQEELEHTPKKDIASMVASQLDIPDVAKDNIEQGKTPSISSRTNQEQSTHHMKEKIVSASLTQSMKKAKLSTSSGNDEYINTPEKLKDLKVKEVPLSITAHHTTEELISLLSTPVPTPSPTSARAVRVKKPVTRYQFSEKTGRLHEEKKVSTKQQKDCELENQRKDPMKSRGRPSKSLAKSRLTAAVGRKDDTICSEEECNTKEAELPLTIGSSVTRFGNSVDENPQQPTDDDSPTVINDAKKYSNDLVDNNTMALNQQEDGGSGRKRKRGRPRKLVIPDSSEGLHQNLPECASETKTVKDHASDKAALPIHEKMPNLQDASITNKAEVSGKQASDNADEEDRPLSTWFGGMHNPSGSYNRTSEVGNKPRQHIDAKNGTSKTVLFKEIVSKESQGFPFVKSSTLWETIESMPVFSTMPQNPHFEPLSNCKEECREGLAIGTMVIFSNLVKRISKLQIEDPGSTFTSTLDSLIDLEKHGFDVTILRTRVNELVSIKDRQGQFVNKSKNCESKMTEHTHKRTLLVEEMDDIAKKISELQDKHALLKSKLEKRDVEIEKLKLEVDAMDKRFKSARLDFEKLVASPM